MIMRKVKRRGHRRAVLAMGLLVVVSWLVGQRAGVAAVAGLQPDLQLEAIAREVFSDDQVAKLWEAAIALPLATLLGAALALRPKRPGTPRRSSAVVQTQIILAVVGALVMLVVGASLARAFGVLGAAGLIRYRAKIDDPKDAVVMLSTLAVGLSAGVGLYAIAVFATLFILCALWLIESFEPSAYKSFTLKVTSKEAAKLQPLIEDLLQRRHTKFELRTASLEEVCYAVQLPIEMRTDALSYAIRRLDGSGGTAVEWDQKKDEALAP